MNATGPERALRAIWLRWLAPLLAGFVAALGQAPFFLWPLALLGFAVLFALFHRTRTTGSALRAGWLGGLGYFGLSLIWIVEPFLVDAARYGWMAPFALLLMAGGGGLFWAVAFGVARRLNGGALLWIVTLGAVEMLRAYIFTGFPWSLIGYALTPSPYVQLAAFIGPHGLTLATLIMAVGLWRLSQPRPWAVVLPMMVIFALLFVWGQQRAGDSDVLASDAPVLRLIQPNAPQHQKWDPTMMPVFFNRLLDGTGALPAPDMPTPDLIIWPETSVPALLEDAAGVFSVIAERAGGVPVVLGIQRREDRRYYNSALLLDANGEVAALYDKHHLVPFGEYIPYGDFLAGFGISAFAAQEGHGFSAGPGARLMDLGALGMALPLICYEAVFPQGVAAAPMRPRFLLQLTNDAWFGAFSGPYQHLSQARMRAIEQGLPLVRAANTGVSAVIDAHGTIRAQLPLGVAGHLDAHLPPSLAPTLYSRSGDLPLALLLAALLVGLGWRGYNAKRNSD